MRSWLAPETINRMAADPAHCMNAEPNPVVDMTKPFVHEHQTQLYYTPVYASLHYEHRLRYNQLFALRINEYIMMLEQDLVDRLLDPLIADRRVAADPQLAQALATMVDEERRHFKVFANLNRTARPDLYPPGRDRLFSDLPVWTRGMFVIAGLLASRLAFSLWYLMALEEASMSLAKEYQRGKPTEGLGPIDDAFANVHIEHLKDEVRHVHIDGILIDLCIGKQSERRKRLNARLFQSMLGGVTTPTRGGSGVKVIRQLVRDMPELQDREEEMIRSVLALKTNNAFQKSLFNRTIMPLTFGVFDRTEELAGLERSMTGYDRR